LYSTSHFAFLAINSMLLIARRIPFTRVTTCLPLLAQLWIAFHFVDYVQGCSSLIYNTIIPHYQQQFFY
jgi:hypothetical protein